MGAAQPSPAPLQLENLTPAQLLERYCETREELYVVALWQRFADLQQRRGEIYNALRWTSRRYCPPGYNPEWMLSGSHTRAYLRFVRHIGLFIGRLDTPQFKRYKGRLVESSVIDEYWFVKGEGKAIWVHIHPEYEVVDDTGQIHRTERTEEFEAWEELDHARLEDERHLAELQGVVREPTSEEHEAEATEPDEPELFIENESAVAPGGGEAARVCRNLGLAQPLPRPDAALSQKERKLIIRFLILDHLIRAGKVHSSICVYRFFFLTWPKARIAVLCFGEPPDVTIRNRHEKRVHDTLIHDLRDMKQVLKEKFGMTSIRQV